jgi:hypothetical protein
MIKSLTAIGTKEFSTGRTRHSYFIIHVREAEKPENKVKFNFATFESHLQEPVFIKLP